MHPYPHTYTASAIARDTGVVTVTSPRLPALETGAPPEFDGPEGLWSPETLLCASLADCFILTFRAIARTGRLPWLQLECRVEGVLESVERVPQFTRYLTVAKLTIPPGGDAAKAREALERTERGCLIANSLRGSRTLESEVAFAGGG